MTLATITVLAVALPPILFPLSFAIFAAIREDRRPGLERYDLILSYHHKPQRAIFLPTEQRTVKDEL